MKVPEEIYHLILSRLSGQAEAHETDVLDAWLVADPLHEQMYKQVVQTLLLTEWAEKKETISKEAAWDAIKRKRHTMRRKRIAVWSSVAASLVLVIAATLWLSLPASDPAHIDSLALIGPPGNKVIIELSDGQRHMIDMEEAELTEKDGTQLDVSNREITYGKTDHHVRADKEIMYNKVIIPKGAGVYKITLSDGTRVWLNTDSELEYPLEFAAHERKVRLCGEAYFEVASDTKRTFTITSLNQEVTVLGTKFNICAYPEETVQTTLVSGKVKVSCITSAEEVHLSPGQQSRLAHSSSQFSVSTVNVQHFITWKNGYINLDDRNLSEILKMVSRSYNVVFETIDPDIGNTLLGGSFSMDESLNVVLTVLEKIGDVKFKKEADGKITVLKQ